MWKVFKNIDSTGTTYNVEQVLVGMNIRFHKAST